MKDPIPSNLTVHMISFSKKDDPVSSKLTLMHEEVPTADQIRAVELFIIEMRRNYILQNIL